MPRIGSRLSRGAGPAADPPRTSCSVIRPCGPVPVTVERSTPSSCASRRTSGVARTLSRGTPAALATIAGSAAGAAALVPSPPMTTSTVPTGTTAPSCTRICVTVPAAGERVVLGDLLPFLDEPAGDLALGQTLAEIGELELVRHAARSLASQRVVAEHGMDAFGLVDDLGHVQVD